MTKENLTPYFAAKKSFALLFRDVKVDEKVFFVVNVDETVFFIVNVNEKVLFADNVD